MNKRKLPLVQVFLIDLLLYIGVHTKEDDDHIGYRRVLSLIL